MPDEQLGRHFWLTSKGCAARFFAPGSLQSSLGGEENVAVMQSAVSICVRRVTRAIVNAGTRNNFVASRSEQKAPFRRLEGNFALNVVFICVANMPILAVDPLRPGLDDDSLFCVGLRI
ncbi:hypothetical protein MRX96_034267 [Rhipicephalus microplus]